MKLGIAFLVSVLCAHGTLISKPARRLTRKEIQAHKQQDREMYKKFKDIEDLKKKTNWGKKPESVSAPPHIMVKAKQAVDSFFSQAHFVKKGECGSTVKASSLGLRFGLLQAGNHPGQDSFSKPGAGVGQVLKDEGMSTHGTLDGVEPYVTVLKDGYSAVGCYSDGMLEFGDKFSNNKFKYAGAGANVSIVVYKEMVLDEKVDPMTPIVCYEFCRTMPNMVFFGINNGNNCYCMPYYKSAAGDGKQCDTPCEGDPTKMCGNKDKSSIWEMHLCANTAEVLRETMVKAKGALDFYFEGAVMSNELANQMTRSGIALEKVAGLSGGPGAADNGMLAKKSAKELSQAYQPGFKTYQALLKAYKDATNLKDADFGQPAFVSAAEKSIREMKATTTPVMEFAAAMSKTAKLAYPPMGTATFGDDPDPADPVAMKLATEGSADGFDFRPASYAWDTTFPSDVASCSGGPLIGLPIVGLGLPQCAKACEATEFPKTCIAFSHYTLYEDERVDGKGLSDLCFLFEDVLTLETFTCPSAGALNQVNTTVLRGASAANGEAHGTAYCGIRMSQIATGYRPSPMAKWKKNQRCFKATQEKAVSVPEAFQTFKMPAVSEMEAEGKDTIAAPP